MAEPAGAQDDAALLPILVDIMGGFAKTKVAYLMARLNVPEALSPAGTHKDTDTLAKELKAHGLHLYRVLRLAGQVGLVTEHEDGTWSVTQLGMLLSADHPLGMKELCIATNLNTHNQSLSCLYEAVLDGQSGCAHAFGVADGFQVLYKDEYERKTFTAAMSNLSRACVGSCLAFDFSSCKKVVDVGGAAGIFLRAVLEKYPGLMGVNVDLPSVINGQPPVEALLAGRLTNVSGDFFKPLPVEAHDADAITLKHVLHDWSDDLCVEILKNCKEALAPGGKIVVVDMLYPKTAGKPPGTASPLLLMSDLIMMGVTAGGMDRTLEQFTDLFKAAGLAPPTVMIPNPMMPACLVTQRM